MIGLTRLNGRPIVINADLIETVESTPDTVISLTNGKKFVVLESPDEVVDLAICYRHRSMAGAAETVVRAPRRASSATQHED